MFNFIGNGRLFWEFTAIGPWFINYYKYRGNISSIFSRNSEANASEFLENLQDMFSSVLHNHILLLSVAKGLTMCWIPERLILILLKTSREDFYFLDFENLIRLDLLLVSFTLLLSLFFVFTLYYEAGIKILQMEKNHSNLDNLCYRQSF